jgi:hypothetical protein
MDPNPDSDTAVDPDSDSDSDLDSDSDVNPDHSIFIINLHAADKKLKKFEFFLHITF